VHQRRRDDVAVLDVEELGDAVALVLAEHGSIARGCRFLAQKHLQRDVDARERDGWCQHVTDRREDPVIDAAGPAIDLGPVCV